MRVLFSTTAGAGHFGPMVPFARACRDAGHEVKVAAPASFADTVTATGFEHAPFADVPPEVLGPIFGRLSEMSRVEADRTVMAEVFGRLGAQAALPGLTDIIASWRPDLVAREFCEFGSLVTAEKAGIPQVEVAIGFAAGLASALAVVASPLAELDAIAGLPQGTASRALASGPVLSCIPAEVDGEHESGVLRVLMTTGNGIEPASLAPLPANARVEQWRPQASVMAQADVVVGRGGFGTTMTALAGSVPPGGRPAVRLRPVRQRRARRCDRGWSPS